MSYVSRDIHSRQQTDLLYVFVYVNYRCYMYASIYCMLNIIHGALLVKKLVGDGNL